MHVELVIGNIVRRVLHIIREESQQVRLKCITEKMHIRHKPELVRVVRLDL